MNPLGVGKAAPLARSGFGSGEAGFPRMSPLPVGAISTGVVVPGLVPPPGTLGGSGVCPYATDAHMALVNRKAILCGVN